MNICFDEGFREFEINGGRTIRIKPGDFSLPKRMEALNEWAKSFEPGKTLDELEESDREARKQLDAVLGEGVSDIIFGDMNCMSYASGKPVFINFIEAFFPIIEAELNAEKEKSDANIKKYTSQVQ